METVSTSQARVGSSGNINPLFAYVETELEQVRRKNIAYVENKFERARRCSVL
jgi:hypothetical protein